MPLRNRCVKWSFILSDFLTPQPPVAMDEKPKNMKKLTAMETKLFISLMENKRCLYDKDAPGFKDVAVRDNAWQEIHQSMAKPGTNGQSLIMHAS